jgi:predicted ATP-grasp superfamily ATP-dependent carboligase
MRIFLSEYLTCGAALHGDVPAASLAVEGTAMLRAIAADAAAVPGWKVSVAWDESLGDFGVPGVSVKPSRSPADERRNFERLTREADVTLVIAPEFDDILQQRAQLIEAAGGRSAGSTREAIALCADKLLLAHHLAERGVATIPTGAFEPSSTDLLMAKETVRPVVIKPRFGAGSIDTFILPSRAASSATWDSLRSPSFRDFIVQPFIEGRALSVAGIASTRGIEMWPVCSQNIIVGETLSYAGGTVRADTQNDELVTDLARVAVESVPGLRGYVGVDLVLPNDGPPVIVEINPRLTSSYLGYRRIAKANLAQRVLQPDAEAPPRAWDERPISFFPDGTAIREEEITAESRRRREDASESRFVER